MQTSLTFLQSDRDIPLALSLFNSLFIFMENSSRADAASLVEDLLQVGILRPEFRDEMFVQVIKQLNNNPRRNSERRGWFMLKQYLLHFPPSQELENYLELWIRRKSIELRDSKYPHECLLELHRIVFNGVASRIKKIVIPGPLCE